MLGETASTPVSPKPQLGSETGGGGLPGWLPCPSPGGREVTRIRTVRDSTAGSPARPRRQPAKVAAMHKRIVLCFALLALLGLSLSSNGCQSAMIEQDSLPVVVRRELTGDPRTIDPHKSGDVISSAQSGMAYEQLYEYHYLARRPLIDPAKVPPPEPGAKPIAPLQVPILKGALAADLPTVSEDRLTYTIPLRQDVYFQDDECFPNGIGRKFKADDVIYSIKRFASLSDTTGWWAAEGKIVGLDTFRTFAISLLSGITPGPEWIEKQDEILQRDVAGLKKIDDYTVQITLTQPYPQFIYTLTMSYFAIIAREALQHYGTNLFRNPVGTGPFKLVHWDFNRELLWERNPKFGERGEVFPELPDNPIVVGEEFVDPAVFKNWVGKKLPLADRMSFRIIKEPQAAWLEFLAGNIDVYAPQTDQFSVAVQNDSLTEEMIERGISLDRYLRPVVEYFNFNMDDPIMGLAGGETARAVRKAFSTCLNREEYLRTYLNGRGVPATMFVPNLFPEFDPDYIYEHSHHDPEKGRQILRDAGFTVTEDGPNGWKAIDPRTGQQATITLLLRGTHSTARNTATYLQTSGRKIGIDVNGLMMEFPEWLDRAYTGKGQAYNGGWVMDYPDAQNLMKLLYGPQAVDNGSNTSRYRNDRYDDLFRRISALSSADPVELEQKRVLIREAHDVVAEDCPWIPHHFVKTYRLNHQWTLQAIPNDFAYNLYKYDASISSERKRLATEWRVVPILPGLLLALLFGSLTGLFFFKVVRSD